MRTVVVFVTLVFLLSLGSAAPVIRQEGELVSPSFKPATCTEKQAELQIKEFKKLDFDNSKCAAEDFLPRLHQHFPSADGKLFVNIGANKGFLLAKMMSLWAPWVMKSEATPTGASVARYLGSFWKGQGGKGAACDEYSVPFTSKSTTPYNAAWPRMIGVELNPTTAAPLREVMGALKATEPRGSAPPALRVLNFGVASKDGEMLLGKLQPGVESIGVKTFDHQQAKLQNALKEHADDVVKVGLRTFKSIAQEHFQKDERLFLLAVDTEGNDPVVIESALQTLRDHKTEIVLFEYHNAWVKDPSTNKQYKLGELTTKLEGIGYECFMPGTKGLWRITGCHHEEWDFYEW
eukprot:CAMPEP_0185848152 /NCGR_PEP_ID=MMETSP1354-20130828/3141_1 /TAXON_ID=708628 /ORGANISM="Erythrolobus madagascarensis, Strain CCMP3276" /LENGTH=348 /DNA_ID=CAMNT_0028548515 /DNA_START=9 /DNA_END=1052 /DNA_ORIENTATION=-